MKYRLFAGTVIVASLALLLMEVPAGSAGPPAEKPAANFTLKDAQGKEWALHEQKASATVVAFLSLDCPMSNSYLPHLADIAARYEEQGVNLIGIVPDADATEKHLAAHVKEYRVPFPVYIDRRQQSVDSLSPRVTPEVLVLDGRHIVRYRGRIDDSYTARLKKKAMASRQDLAAALDELLAGKAISMPETTAFGCAISRPEPKQAAGTQVTYYKDVLPLLQAHCQGCHREGQVGPFPLETYKHAAKWADLAIEEIKAKRMPPWKPAPNPLLAGERHLPGEAVETLERWVALGMPEGDPKTAPAPIEHRDEWVLGEPDLILESPEPTTIAATGNDHFRVVVFPTNFAEDRYLAAMEVKPGNPRVVHHTVQLLDRTGNARKLQAEAARNQKPDDPDRGPGYPVAMGVGFLADPSNMIGGWAPGLLPKRLPEGVGQRLPKGADICVQFHFHRTGKVETDRTRIGVYFARKPVTEVVHTIPPAGLFWSIPAGAKDHKVHTAWRLTDDVKVYRLVPHMHLIGKEIELTATPPGGQEMSLIRIPAWDYNWQEQYELKQPLELKEGTILRVRATYDNSADNPANPSSPPRPVMLGEQTTNEMCFVFMGVSSIKTGPRVLSPAFGLDK